MGNLIDSIKRSIEEYIGVYPAHDKDSGSVLDAMVAQHSASIYLDEEKLRSTLKTMNVDDASALKICLMTKVTGFRDLIKNDERTQQIDLERYVKNAVRETGFNRSEVMRLTSDIAVSVGAASVYKSHKADNTETVKESAFVIPASLYEADLEKFQRMFEKSGAAAGDFSNLNFDCLEPLVAAGLPKAKFYLGYCMLKGIGVAKNTVAGPELMKEAAEAGDVQAAAVLGDYYYHNGIDTWNEAYDCYTGFGSLQLNKARREAVTGIFNQKRFNRRLLWLNIILFAIMLASFIFAPGSAIYPARRVLGGICAVADLAFLVMAILHYRVKPYGNLYYVTAGMFALWSLYIAVRLIFL